MGRQETLRRLAWCVVAVVVAVLIGGGVPTSDVAGKEVAEDKAAAGTEHMVMMVDDNFKDDDITINQGDSVRWVNKGTKSHSATSDDIGNNGDTFNTARVKPGQSAVVNFNKTGTFMYHCVFHTDMKGKITVK
jgi:plastocyanin